MSSLEKYQRLKTAAEQAQREADRAAGALQQLMGQLKEEFGCTTIKQARRMLKGMKREQAELESQLDEQIAEFEHAYPDLRRS